MVRPVRAVPLLLVVPSAHPLTPPAPVCSCKKLKPTWDTLGERYANVKSKLTVAKFDATENDVPSSAGFRVAGFPTIKFKAAGSTEWISYEGDRSLDSLVEFLEANATNDINEPDSAEAELDGESEVKSGRHDELVRPLSLSCPPSGCPRGRRLTRPSPRSRARSKRLRHVAVACAEARTRSVGRGAHPPRVGGERMGFNVGAVPPTHPPTHPPSHPPPLSSPSLTLTPSPICLPHLASLSACRNLGRSLGLAWFPTRGLARARAESESEGERCTAVPAGLQHRDGARRSCTRESSSARGRGRPSCSRPWRRRRRPGPSRRPSPTPSRAAASPGRHLALPRPGQTPRSARARGRAKAESLEGRHGELGAACVRAGAVWCGNAGVREE